MAPDVLTLAAPAKLNLYLHVTGKRQDGYHLLDSLVAFVDVCDRIAIAPANELTFHADGLFAGAFAGEDPAGNLVVRAARALAAVAGRDITVALSLTKNLPVASGIGGGSADAAACLRGLAQLWGIDPAGEAVMAVAAELGSDIPACVAGRACYMGGVGTELSPAPALPAAGLLLVNPGIGLSTPSVYRARQGDFTPAMRFDTPPADARALAALLADRRNDLTKPAIAQVPQIATVLDAIAQSEGCLLSRMSGSGATCFGLFDDVAEAARAADAIRAANPNWWVAPGRLIQNGSVLDA
jgi:4-diphosphocytidyl-2-C-methyl-D-erythritol kinase